jgi:hypothetical protein
MKRLAILSAAFPLIAIAAQAGDLRTMMQQPGEWEITAHGGFMPVQPQRGCYGGGKSVADLVNKNMKNCSQQSVNIGGGSATVDAVCQMQGVQVTVHSDITSTGDGDFHAENRVQIAGVKSMPDMTISVDGHRLGACQPGEKQL